MVERSFLDYWSLNHHSNIWSCYLRPNFGHPFPLMFNCVYFSLSIHHYIIWSDKCYLLVHLTMETHLLGNLEELSLSQSATSSPLLDLMMNSCFGTRSHRSIPENLTLSSRQLCCTFYSHASWVWGILTSVRSESRSDMMVGTYLREL